MPLRENHGAGRLKGRGPTNGMVFHRHASREAAAHIKGPGEMQLETTIIVSKSRLATSSYKARKHERLHNQPNLKKEMN
ncbi:MAG: hypothetical protein AAFY84_09420 [Pseudomonadota bacterium]